MTKCEIEETTQKIVQLNRRIIEGEETIKKQKSNQILDVLGEWGGYLETNQMKLEDLKEKREKLLAKLRG